MIQKTANCPGFQAFILLMEEILHHLGCINPVNNRTNYLSTGAGFQPPTVCTHSFTSWKRITIFEFYCMRHLLQCWSLSSTCLGAVWNPCQCEPNNYLSSHHGSVKMTFLYRQSWRDVLCSTNPSDCRKRNDLPLNLTSAKPSPCCEWFACHFIGKMVDDTAHLLITKPTKRYVVPRYVTVDKPLIASWYLQPLIGQICHCSTHFSLLVYHIIHSLKRFSKFAPQNKPKLSPKRNWIFQPLEFSRASVC